MKYETLIIEKKEFIQMKNLLSMVNHANDGTLRASIVKFQKELENATILSSSKMPDDVIRINSFVTITTPFSTEKEYQLVMPAQSNLAQGKISLASPMGIALFGYASHDEIIWDFPSGPNPIKITQVRQHEINEKSTLL